MDRQPLVSVLVPTLHRPDLLTGAVETALGQTYDRIEVVVVNDDAADEETRSALGAYADDDRVTTIHNDRRRGLSGSRNQAATAADGEYLCILDDDDRWEPSKVARQVARFSNAGDEVGVVYTGGDERDVDGNVINRYRPSDDRRGDVWPAILVDWRMDPHSGHMIRRDVFESVGGFDESLDHGEDWDLTIRIAKSYEYQPLGATLTHKIRHDRNVTKRRAHSNQRQRILLKHGDDIFGHEGVADAFFSLWHRRLGRHDLRDGEWGSAVRNQVISFGYEPGAQSAFDLGISIGGPGVYRAASRLREAVVSRQATGR